MKTYKQGKRNGRWKGDKVGYQALHDWVKRNLIKAQTCRDCNQPKALELANISQEYKRNLSDWEWLCRRCHMLKDGRLDRFKTAPRFGHTKRRKKVLQIRDGKIVAIFESLTQASEITNISKSNISLACNSKRKLAGEYEWKYEKEISI